MVGTRFPDRLEGRSIWLACLLDAIGTRNHCDPCPKSGEPPGPVGAGGSDERVCEAFALGQQQEVENWSHRLSV